MNTVGEGGCYYAKPKFSLWRWLGFRKCSAPRPEEMEMAEGWAESWLIVGIYAHLDWKDRLRVLVSGNLHIDQAVKTDVPIRRSRATSAVSVMRPGKLSDP